MTAVSLAIIIVASYGAGDCDGDCDGDGDGGDYSMIVLCLWFLTGGSISGGGQT